MYTLEFLDVRIGQTNQDGIAVIKVQNAKSKNECLCGSCVRMFLIDLILFQLVSAVLHLILMCFFSVRLASKYPPRNLIWSVLATVSSFTSSSFIVTFLSCCLLPK